MFFNFGGFEGFFNIILKHLQSGVVKHYFYLPTSTSSMSFGIIGGADGPNSIMISSEPIGHFLRLISLFAIAAFIWLLISAAITAIIVCTVVKNNKNDKNNDKDSTSSNIKPEE